MHPHYQAGLAVQTQTVGREADEQNGEVVYKGHARGSVEKLQGELRDRAENTENNICYVTEKGL